MSREGQLLCIVVSKAFPSKAFLSLSLWGHLRAREPGSSVTSSFWTWSSSSELPPCRGGGWPLANTGMPLLILFQVRTLPMMAKWEKNGLSGALATSHILITEDSPLKEQTLPNLINSFSSEALWVCSFVIKTSGHCKFTTKQCDTICSKKLWHKDESWGHYAR